MIARVRRASALWSEAPLFVGTNDVLGTTPSVVDDREHEDMAVAESEEVWALPHCAGMFLATLESGQKWTQVLPTHQIGRAGVHPPPPPPRHARSHQPTESRRHP